MRHQLLLSAKPMRAPPSAAGSHFSEYCVASLLEAARDGRAPELKLSHSDRQGSNAFGRHNQAVPGFLMNELRRASRTKAKAYRTSRICSVLFVVGMSIPTYLCPWAPPTCKEGCAMK